MKALEAIMGSKDHTASQQQIQKTEVAGKSGKPDSPVGKHQTDPARRKTVQGNGIAMVIVESPAKARTISKYLGSGYVVESSIGHIRDLPSTASEIPPEVKNESWARMGVNVDKDFEPLYIIPAKKKAQVTKLRQLLRRADALYLATDEDREGEAIAWHLFEILKPRVPVKRMVFEEITETAIRNALANPRDVDDRLVDAQEARRILDRLYGYELSPVLWRKIGPKLSAGRVQSVATRLIVDRERERMQFVSAGYWDVEAGLLAAQSSSQQIQARMVELGKRRLATGKDFDERTGQLNSAADVQVLDEATARSVAESLQSAIFIVADVAEKPFTQKAYPPFITSTLQQEAARKLRYPVKMTMRLAQELYENGYITYMRTDSTSLSSQALDAARRQVTDLYGVDYLPPKPRVYTTSTKGAQEAHEAIRPAGAVFRLTKDLEGEVKPEALKLYDLIWKRTIASQMKDAVGLRTTVRTAAPTGQNGEAIFTASGKVITFPGFLRAYVEGADDPEAELEDQERILPPLVRGQRLTPVVVTPRSHTTVPPARFTEASLIRELEERGIGRPSTYAAIIQTIQDRGYVWKKGGALVPTFTAFAVINLLEKHFPDLVDYGFTAKMENDLDAIAAGRLESTPWLHVFYFGNPKARGGQNDDVVHIGLKRRVGSGWEQIDAREISTIPLCQNDHGEPIFARIGRYGPYLQVGDSEQRANLPAEIAPDELGPETVRQFFNKAAQGDVRLGDDPTSGKPVYLKNGRFGPYVQLGDPERTEKGNLKRGGKPKMASLWPSMNPSTMTLKDALLLLSFPRTLGIHPQTNQPITVQDGRFGPYVKMGEDTRSLSSHEQLATLRLEDAIALLAQPKQRRGQVRIELLVDLGAHPRSGAALQIKNGRFGPFVTDGILNASVPKGQDPKTLTIEQAVKLLEAREEKLRQQGIDPKAPKKSKKSFRRKAKVKSSAGSGEMAPTA